MIKKFFGNLFKNFFRFFFKLLYGKIEIYKNDLSNLNIETKKINIENSLKVYKLYVIPKSRLYTDRIHNVAIIKNKQLLPGPSLQIKDNSNSPIINNIVLKNGTPRLKKNINGTLLSLLTGGGGNDNYFHWLFDVLPRIAICEKNNILKNIEYFLCPNINKWQKETLILLNIPVEKLLNSKKFRHVEANSLIVTDHPWQHSRDANYDIQNIPEWISSWLREKFLKKIVEENLPKKIYIDRSDSLSNLKDKRKILNEEDVKSYLKKNGFISVQLSKLKFSKQISLFYNCEKILGLHGAGLSNLIWSKENTKIFEIKNIDANNLYENLAIQNNLQYKSLSLKSETAAISPDFGFFKIEIDRLDDLINS